MTDAEIDGLVLWLRGAVGHHWRPEQSQVWAEALEPLSHEVGRKALRRMMSQGDWPSLARFAECVRGLTKAPNPTFIPPPEPAPWERRSCADQVDEIAANREKRMGYQDPLAKHFREAAARFRENARRQEVGLPRLPAVRIEQAPLFADDARE